MALDGVIGPLIGLLPYLLIWLLVQPLVVPLVRVAASVHVPRWAKPRDDVPRDHLDRALREVIAAARTVGPGVTRDVLIGGDPEYPQRRIRRIRGIIAAGYVSYVIYAPGALRWSRVLVVPQRLVHSWHTRTLVVDGRGIHRARGVAYVLPPTGDPGYVSPHDYLDDLYRRAWEPLISVQLVADVEDAGATETLRAMLDRDPTPIDYSPPAAVAGDGEGPR